MAWSGSTARTAMDRPVLTSPLDVRAVSLTVLATLAAVAAMHVAAGFLVPVVVAVLVAYALEPLVRTLAAWSCPRPLAAAAVLGVMSGGVVLAGYQLADETAAVLTKLPAITEQLKRDVRQVMRNRTGAVAALEEAAADLETVAREAAGRSPAVTPGVGRVEIVPVPLSLRSSLLWGSVSALSLAGQGLMLFFFVFFLLASGDQLKRKVVQIAGPTLSEKKVTVQVLDDINRTIERFLVIVLATNVLVGLASWAIFSVLGLRQAAAWAVLGGVANTVPYFGSAAASCIFFAVAMVQFDSVQQGLVVAAAFIAVTSLEGLLVKPWLMCHGARMNSVALFIGLLFFGWLWGAWGLLLAFPVLMVLKVVADRVEGLQPLGALMSD